LAESPSQGKKGKIYCGETRKKSRKRLCFCSFDAWAGTELPKKTKDFGLKTGNPFDAP
jgi:hypothetical protein